MLDSRHTTIDKNEILIEEDRIVRLTLDGKQSANGLKETFDIVDSLLLQLKQAAKPALLLVLVTAEMRSDLKGRLLSIGWARRAPFDRVAIYSPLPSHVVDSNNFLKVIGLTRKMRVFDNEEAAVEWLIA